MHTLYQIDSSTIGTHQLHLTWFTYNCYTESYTPQPVDLTPIPQLLPYMQSFFSFGQHVGKCDSARDRFCELSTNQMPLLLTEPRAIYQSYSRRHNNQAAFQHVHVHSWTHDPALQPHRPQRSMLAAATGALAPSAVGGY